MRKHSRIIILAGMVLLGTTAAFSQDPAGGGVLPAGIQVRFDPADSPQQMSQSLRILLLMTALSLAPSALIMTTSFTRIYIVLGIVRQAMSLQNVPPNQVVAGIALFLTMFTMAPVWEKINNEALKPHAAEEISDAEAWDRGIRPLKTFMLGHTGEQEMSLFYELAGRPDAPDTPEDIDLHILIPAFMMTELKTALQMAFLIYLPFLVIDLVVASSLMSLGMMMLPPMMIALPIKILLFVLADGWNMLIRGLVRSFAMT